MRRISVYTNVPFRRASVSSFDLVRTRNIVDCPGRAHFVASSVELLETWFSYHTAREQRISAWPWPLSGNLCISLYSATLLPLPRPNTLPFVECYGVFWGSNAPLSNFHPSANTSLYSRESTYTRDACIFIYLRKVRNNVRGSAYSRRDDNAHRAATRSSLTTYGPKAFGACGDDI